MTLNGRNALMRKESFYGAHQNKKVVLSQGEPHDAVHFDTYRIFQRHRAVSLPQHGFLVGSRVTLIVNVVQVGVKCAYQRYIEKS